MDNKVTNQSILYGVLGIVLGVLLAGYAANTNNMGMMRMMGMNQAHTMMNDSSMSMDDMMDSLDGKTGNEFDKAFITGMIEHHEGAIDMANAAKLNAGHDEIKNMANDIISAQSREIAQMREWYKNWFGTDVPSTSDHMMH
jgi:uncharacterized protein (DUF305 family)